MLNFIGFHIFIFFHYLYTPAVVVLFCHCVFVGDWSHCTVRGLRVSLYWKISNCTWWGPATGEYSPLQQCTWKGCQDIPSKKLLPSLLPLFGFKLQNKSFNKKSSYIIGIYYCYLILCKLSIILIIKPDKTPQNCTIH